MYLKIPNRYQVPPKDPKGPFVEAIYFGIDGGLAITCQREGGLGAILWHFDKQPRVVDLSSIAQPPYPAQLPAELSDFKQFRQDRRGWFYAELPQSKYVSVARSLEGGYFVVVTDHTKCEYVGLTTADGKAWQWKHVFPPAAKSPSIELPVNFVPLKELVFVEQPNGSSIARLKTVAADGVHTQTELSSDRISLLAISSNQKFALIDYSLDGKLRPINEAYAVV